MNFHTMEIGDMNQDTPSRMADPDDWVSESGGGTQADPDDWVVSDDADAKRPNLPTSGGVGAVQSDPSPAPKQDLQQPKQALQQQEAMPPETERPYNDVALKKTVSAERTGSALTTQTIPETPPRQQQLHTTDHGRSVSMDNMFARNFPADADENKHDPEQPDDDIEMTMTAPKISKWNKIFYFLLAFLLVSIAGALGVIVYIQFFHNVGLETKAPTTEPSAAPTEIPSLPPSLRPTLDPSVHPTMSPTTPAPTTRPPTSPPSRRPSSVPSVTPTTSPTETPSLSPTSVQMELRNLITRITDGRTIQAIDTQGTPQQRAYEWLLEDPAYFDFKQFRIVQRFAMATLYYSTVGSQTSTEAMATWLDYDTNECAWFTSWYENRIPCGSDDVFKTLALRNVALMGTIPSELALLTHLNNLVLTDNVLTGTLPREFGRWTSLVKLDLHSNFISGTIPAWTNTPNLQEINLGNNRFSGNLPSSIANLNLVSLDLSGNNVQGAIPSELCANSDQIELMTVDCEKVACTCCTQCGQNRTRAPVLAPFRAPPSPAPTKNPFTPSPTKTPSLFSTDGPTSISTNLPLPTTRPTSDGITGCNSISFSKQCYNIGEPIQVNFYNCDPLYADWVGLYDAQTSIENLQDPYLWHRSCGNQACLDSPVYGSSTMAGSSTGLSSWPLPAGTYRVYLLRNTANKPYQAAFGSQEMRVSQIGCPN